MPAQYNKQLLGAKSQPWHQLSKLRPQWGWRELGSSISGTGTLSQCQHAMPQDHYPKHCPCTTCQAGCFDSLAQVEGAQQAGVKGLDGQIS